MSQLLITPLPKTLKLQSVKEIVKELKVFERNKVPLEITVLEIATYIQTSSVSRTANPVRNPSCIQILSSSPDKEV